MIAEDDMVVVHAAWYDTAGGLLQNELNDQSAALREIAIYCVIDGMIVERWSALDRGRLPQRFDALLFTQEVGL